MTRDEVKKILMVVSTTYPNWRPENMSNTVDVWTVIFKDYEHDVIENAVMDYIKNDNKGFAPVPGQIIANIKTGKTYLNEEEAWNLVYKGICNSNYCAQEEFNKLPIECQRAIASPYNMRELAALDIGTVQSVEKSHFIKTYRAEIERQMKQDKTPEGLLEIKQAQIGAKDDEIRRIESVG